MTTRPDVVNLLRDARPAELQPERRTDVSTDPDAARILARVLGHQPTIAATNNPLTRPVGETVELVTTHDRQARRDRRRRVAMLGAAASIAGVAALAAVISIRSPDPTPVSPADTSPIAATTPVSTTKAEVPATTTPATSCGAITDIPGGAAIITVTGEVTFSGTTAPASKVSIRTPAGYWETFADGTGNWELMVNLGRMGENSSYPIVIDCWAADRAEPTTNTIYSYRDPDT